METKLFKVTSNQHEGHLFKIGEVVELVTETFLFNRLKRYKSVESKMEQYLFPEEIEPINSTQL